MDCSATATARAAIAIKPRLIVTTAEAAIDAAARGFGLTRVLSYQAAEEIASGALVRLLQDYEGDDVAGPSALSGRPASAAEAAGVPGFRHAAPAAACEAYCARDSR